ncbi:MAG: RNA polymerase sigma factor [Candidatus Omnitrophica bacterium]|nr:RNA polymerase sigma factor [Candidatus Omnitrophota bacterium]
MQEIAQDILERSAAGDLEAFESLYKVSSGFVYTVAFRVLHRHQDAEEITQDVFVSVYKNLGKFEFRSSFKTWIYRITINAALNRAKKNSKERKTSVVLNDYQIDSESYKNHQEQMEKDSSGLAQELLEVLNPDQKACVILRSIEGLSYHEIAESLKIKINTVRTRLKRAREKMSEYYKKRGDYDEL